MTAAAGGYGEITQWAVRVVRMTAPTEMIFGPFYTHDEAWAWLDERRDGLDLIPYQAPQIMPLSLPTTQP